MIISNIKYNDNKSNVNLPILHSNDMVIEDRLLSMEKRLDALEKVVFLKNKKADWGTDDFKGLRGGLRLLVKNGFFDHPRKIKEIEDELKREGYHYPKPSISKALSVDLTNRQKILNRVRDGEQWSYVIRK